MKSPRRIPSPKKQSQSCFYMVSAVVMYERDGELKQRTLNVLAETDFPRIEKANLSAINQAIVRRVHAENNVNPEQVKDVVLLNMFLLGQMTPEEFHGHPISPLDAAPQGQA